jgi:cytochrome P450
MEWTMSLLLNHPDAMEKLRKEIDLHITSSCRLVADSDLSKLPYLHCVINEGLRMFPVAPTLLPHLSSKDCIVNGYSIPSGTTLIVNAYAIHRDPNVWEEPTEFKPERFEGIEKENEGFKFLPFGVGRRSCPGSVMAIRTIALALATLVQCFDWERVGSELVALEEGSGLVMHKAEPLVALCRPRASVADLL